MVKPRLQDSYVYAAKGADGLIKIGRTNSLERRLPYLRCRDHKGAEYIYSVSYSEAEAHGIEQLAHRMANDRHVEGEKFRLTEPEAVALIQDAALRYARGERAEMLPPLINRPKVGRKKLWQERVALSLDTDLLRRVDAARRAGEPRLDLIRAGILAEVERREAIAAARCASDGLTRPAQAATTAVSIGSPRRVAMSAGGSQRRQ